MSLKNVGVRWPAAESRPRPPTTSRLEIQLAQHVRKHSLRIEIRLGQVPGGAGVAQVFPGNALGAGDRFVERTKWDQSLANRVIAAEPGVLDQGGFTGGEVANGSVAHPAALSVDINPLRDRELSARTWHVTAERQWVGRRVSGVDDAPAVVLQRGEIGSVRAMNLQRDLERLRRAFGQRQHLPEFVHLQAEASPLVLDRPERSAPGADGRKP